MAIQIARSVFQMQQFPALASFAAIVGPKEGEGPFSDCFDELLNSLHRQYSPATELSRLYLYCIRRLAACEAKADRTALQDIRKVIAPLCDAYRQIQDQNSSGPVMNNSQTVYAGLTYGRNQLTENMADQGSNRGMLV